MESGVETGRSVRADPQELLSVVYGTVRQLVYKSRNTCICFQFLETLSHFCQQCHQVKGVITLDHRAAHPRVPSPQGWGGWGLGHANTEEVKKLTFP